MLVQFSTEIKRGILTCRKPTAQREEEKKWRNLERVWSPNHTSYVTSVIFNRTVISNDKNRLTNTFISKEAFVHQYRKAPMITR